MKIYAAGYKGSLGRRLVALGALPLDCDVTYLESVKDAIGSVSPEVIIHAAAKSGVDFCEDNPNVAFDVNAYGTNTVMQVANELGIPALFLSSEQVFSGFWGKYKEKSKTKPKNVYGKTKSLAEALVHVWEGKTLRLSRSVAVDDGDIKRAFQYMKDEQEFSVPSFFYRNYQHADFLAQQIMWCAKHFHSLPRVLHIGGEEYLSYHDFASRLAKENGYTGRVLKRTREVKGFAPRPKKCGFNLSLAKKTGVPMFSVEMTIKRLVDEQNSNSSLQE